MAKTIYLVKKNPESKKENTEWMQMSGEEFYRFTRSEEGKGRYFIHLTDDIGYEADEIYIEAGYEEFRSWKQEDNRHRYLMECKDERLILSSDVQVSEDGQLIDTVVDDKVSIEEDYAEQDERERLRTIIRSLEPEERELLNVMYLSGRVRTEQETANELGVSRDMIKRRKKKLFSKIQKLLRPKF